MYTFRYFGAIIYDCIILTAIFFVVTTVCVFFNKGKAIQPDVYWYQLTLLMVWFYYYYLSYRYGGQTIGQRAWRLKLLSSTKPISAWQVMCRFLLLLPALLVNIFSLGHYEKTIQQLTKTTLVIINKNNNR
jgi:uncharacterized RDD family membrane protein YckC